MRRAKTRFLWLGLLLFVAAAVRMPGLGRPLSGHFATRNVAQAMSARNWAEGRADLWHPTLDCLRGGHRAWHLVEVPISAYLSGSAWRLFGGSLDAWGRATSVAMSVGVVGLLYAFVSRRHGRHAALGAGWVLALSPVAVIFGQGFMLEPSIVFFTLATFYSLDRWLTGGRVGWLVAAAVALALLLLTKVYMLVLLLPLAAMVVRQRKTASLRWAAAALALAVLPAAVWCVEVWRVTTPGSPTAARVYYSIRESAAAHAPGGNLLRSPAFYRQAFDDLAGVVLTPVAFLLPWFGLTDRRWRRYVPWLAAMALLVVVLPRKFHEMSYYWLVVLPPLCVLAGLGWARIRRKVRPGPVAVSVLLLLGLIASLRHAAGPSWTTPKEDTPVPAAALAVQELTTPDEPVVTIHGSTLDLLYYCDRPGWALDAGAKNLADQLAECRQQGARYAVVVGTKLPDLPQVASGDGFVVYRLAERR